MARSWHCPPCASLAFRAATRVRACAKPVAYEVRCFACPPRSSTTKPAKIALITTSLARERLLKLRRTPDIIQRHVRPSSFALLSHKMCAAPQTDMSVIPSANLHFNLKMRVPAAPRPGITLPGSADITESRRGYRIRFRSVRSTATRVRACAKPSAYEVRCFACCSRSFTTKPAKPALVTTSLDRNAPRAPSKPAQL